MGSVASKAASGIGSLLGNVLAIPVKSIFGASCEDICSGPWDAICFIENLCVSNLVKLLLILGLCYILLMFVYLLFKVGVWQCIGRSICRMGCAACETYWFALEDITCFLWHKLKKNTRRANRRRCRDMEEGGWYTSTSTSESEYMDSSFHHSIVHRKRKATGERRGGGYHCRRCSSRNRSHRHGHHVRLKTREVSVRVKDGSQARRRRRRNSRHGYVSRPRNHGRNFEIFKRRRLW